MARRYGWQIVPLSTLVIGTGLVALVIIGSIFAFGSYVAQLRRDNTTLINEALREVAKGRPGLRPVDAAHAIAGQLFSPALMVVFVGRVHRVTVFHPLGDSRRKLVVAVRSLDDRSAEPTAHGAFARVVLGAAAIFGLSVERAHHGRIDIYAKDDDAAFVASVRAFALPVGTALALAVLFSILIARILTREALRPLEDVTVALERFAAADFRPQFVATNSRAELGKLARAYNGAVAQVELAFEQRERANAAMRQFIADAGHQLRTPLTIIRGFITLLGDTAAESPADREHILRVMRQQSVLMGALIDNLILLDGWENDGAGVAPEVVDATRLLDDIVTAIGDANEPRSITFAANEIGFVRIDPRDLTHAVTNIVDNALKYTAGDIAVSVEVGEANVAITVRDGGPGMPPDVASHAFDRFYRGQRRDVEGSGLGLAIAKKAVERAGGTIALSTAPERETAIRITLPRAR